MTTPEPATLPHATFILPPELIIRHIPDRSFIGPALVRRLVGTILMAAPWCRPPVDFRQLKDLPPLPMIYRGTWQAAAAPSGRGSGWLMAWEY
jgi:hypothetical protein